MSRNNRCEKLDLLLNWHLYLANSTLRWMFSGQIGSSSMDDEDFAMIVEESNDVHKLWELDRIGISKDTKCTEDVDDMKQFNRWEGLLAAENIEVWIGR